MTTTTQTRKHTLTQRQTTTTTKTATKTPQNKKKQKNEIKKKLNQIFQLLTVAPELNALTFSWLGESRPQNMG